MGFELIDTLTLAGDAAKANEDSSAHDLSAAVVLDGATPLGDGLMPGPSDAAWISHFGARRILAHLRDGDGPRKALRAALADTQKSFEALRRAAPQDVWQTPCASMMLATLSPSALRIASAATGTSPAKSADAQRGRGAEDDLEFLWFGDCAALLKQGDGAVQIVGETLDKRAAEAGRAQKLAQEKGRPSTDRAQFIDALRATRNRINSGSYWLFSPDVNAASHVSRRVIRCAPGAMLLLASDGFLALASDYGAYSADTLMAAAQDKGLAALGEELRAIEAGDAGGAKFPRFKTSDDATALLLALV
ncbi:MAG TPA: hypothetical protein VFQ52_07855 [Rhizomicrobium sp.]|nr:hypothetical protein [Rhizomicrobium sp.]